MKKLFIYVLLLGFFAACGGGEATTQQQSETEQNQQQEEQTDEQEVVSEAMSAQDGVYGYYVGMFEAEEYKPNKEPSYSNKISIVIENISDNKIEGHSVVAGNKRPFSGTAFVDGESYYTVEAKEPGDDKYDGTFSFVIDTENNIVEGQWTSNDKNLSVTKRKYKLKKRAFKYNKNTKVTDNVIYEEFYNSYNDDEGVFEAPTEIVMQVNASTTALTSKDVENLFKGDLEVIRNAIYARHGYSFKNRRMRYLFDQVDWYMPVSTNITAQLTSLEKKNIDLLKRYEKHSAKYYDSYGR